MPTLTLAEAAARLGLKRPDPLRAAIQRGSLRAKKIGPIWTVTEAEVERYRRLYRRPRRSDADEGRKD